MTKIVEFRGQEAGTARAVFESDANAALVPDRDVALSKMNLAFCSDMPQG